MRSFYLPFGGSRFDAASFDGEGYESEYSIRVDVPNADDPNGNYAGAILRVDGAGRDLSGYDALTFYAKASRGVNIGSVGFGLDFIDDKFEVSASDLSLATVTLGTLTSTGLLTTSDLINTAGKVYLKVKDNEIIIRRNTSDDDDY